MACRWVVRGAAHLLALIVALAAVAAPVVVPDVPSIGWASGKRSHDVAALQAVLSTMGCPLSYEELMVASGAAFRTAWWNTVYSYQARVAAPEDYVLLAAEAAGCTSAERRSFPTPDEAWTAVCESIDQGRPVVASQDSAAFVICGYDPAGRQMCVQAYDAQGPEYQLLPFKTYSGPTGQPNELVLVEYDRNTVPPELDWPAVLRRALEYADWPADQEVSEHFAFGSGAYDVWAATLRKGLSPQGAANDASVTDTMALVIADARTCAAIALTNDATLDAAFAEAAQHYMAEAALLRAIEQPLTGMPQVTWPAAGERMTARFPDPNVREQVAQLVEQAKAEEVAAIEALRKALADLGG